MGRVLALPNSWLSRIRNAIQAMRHATVEVHHFFSGVPHVRSSIPPHPKTDFGGKYKRYTSYTPWTIPWLKHTTKNIAAQDWNSGDFGLKSPVIQKTFSAEKCYIYRSTPPIRKWTNYLFWGIYRTITLAHPDEPHKQKYGKKSGKFRFH